MANLNITDERAARRYHQIAALEQDLNEITGALAQCQAHLKELKQAHDALILALRAAARDEGQLPLFHLDAS